MIGLLTIIAVGLLLGMRHATDPDHVIAVSTIVTREHSVKRSALVGAAWGLGHTLTILIVGGAIIFFRITLPPRIGLGMELAVALMLIILGAKNLGPLFAWSAQRPGVLEDDGSRQAPRYHSHGDYVHSHQHPRSHDHPHDPQRNPVALMDRWVKGVGGYQLVRPMIVGVVHGLAGSAAIALLVLSTIPRVAWELVYLGVFGFGTILGMMLITLSIGSTFAFGQKRFARVGSHFAVTAGLISVAFGLFMAYEIFVANGLLTNNVQWIPH